MLGEPSLYLDLEEKKQQAFTLTWDVRTKSREAMINFRSAYGARWVEIRTFNFLADKERAEQQVSKQASKQANQGFRGSSSVKIEV